MVGLLFLLFWGFINLFPFYPYVCYSISTVPRRLVSQQCCSTEIKIMDSPNSAVYLWSFLPFSLRSPEIDAFTLDCCTIIVLHLVCVNDGVDNRQSDGLNAFRPSHHVLSRAYLFFPIPLPLCLKIHARKGVQMKYWCFTHLLLTWTSARSTKLEIMG